ncbi:xanthine dehydrogenase small subunit [Glutamicibacter sp. HZAU]|uniref:xanthine dehydrogenase small subunit n=1 Tax=Glutamicibacter sp. HZAU TaxID=2049891 RepID=UPI000FFBD950|nr:FAD binding domain-containing protein [Glutamicibacter sp. HZAU]RWZ85164.1 2Fe-2S iron-sulfur cluster binding domain-containing protein [Glutamicibacter sp. HZAU]
MNAEATQETKCLVTVNGTVREFDGPPHTNVLDFLRGQQLIGCKEGCAEGECGACSILVARSDGEGSRWTAVNACLLPAASLDGQEVITSEGLGSVADLHPVQAEMANRGGSQCGYCTPGFVCSMAAEYYRPERTSNPAVSAEDGGEHECGPNGFDLHALSGNLCRCTGYRPIRDAAYALGEPEEDDPLAVRTQRGAPDPVATDIQRADTPTGELGRFRRATDLESALQILADEPDTVLVAGATDWGVEVNIKGARARSVLAIDRLPELRQIQFNEQYLELGAGCTLSELERNLAGRVPLLGTLFGQFASRLIRNSATLGGNLGTGSPIGDTPPALLALDAELVLSSIRGNRVVALAEYFTGYRQTVREPGEMITAIRIPLPLAELTSFQKISKRRFDDIASVAVGYAVTVEDGVISKARIGLGGVAATPLRAKATEETLEGKEWNLDTIRAAASIMGEEGTPMDDHRASASYRKAMLASSLERFYAEQLSRSGAGQEQNS